MIYLVNSNLKRKHLGLGPQGAAGLQGPEEVELQVRTPPGLLEPEEQPAEVEEQPKLKILLFRDCVYLLSTQHLIPLQLIPPLPKIPLALELVPLAVEGALMALRVLQAINKILLIPPVLEPVPLELDGVEEVK